MEFSFETIYDHMTMTAMAKAIRKVYRRRKSLYWRLFGLAVFIIGVFNSTPLGGVSFKFTAGSVLSYISLIFILIAVLFEDSINGLLASKRVVLGADELDITFLDDEYVIKTDRETTQWKYDRVKYITESRRFFVFVFNENFAQVFEKETLAGGTLEEFREFICKKTEKDIIKV